MIALIDFYIDPLIDLTLDDYHLHPPGGVSPSLKRREFSFPSVDPTLHCIDVI